MSIGLNLHSCAAAEATFHKASSDAKAIEKHDQEIPSALHAGTDTNTPGTLARMSDGRRSDVLLAQLLQLQLQLWSTWLQLCAVYLRYCTDHVQLHSIWLQ